MSSYLVKTSGKRKSTLILGRRPPIERSDEVDQFLELNQSIRDFCEAYAEHIGEFKRLPPPMKRFPRMSLRKSPRTPPASNNSPVGKAAGEFNSVADYSLAVLLAIINNRIYTDIFQPFHPVASHQDNSWYEAKYEAIIDESSQLTVASWRSKKYKSIDDKISVAKQSRFLQAVISDITRELNFALNHLPGDMILLDSFAPELEDILKMAYQWNRTVKVDVLRYDLEPFVVEPSSYLDTDRMDVVEYSKPGVRRGDRIISCFSLGIMRNVSHDDMHVECVQQKAGVLVDFCPLKPLKTGFLSRLHSLYH